MDNINSPALNTISSTKWTSFQSHLKELLPGNPKINTKEEIDEAIVNFNNQYHSAINCSSKLKIIQSQPYTIPPSLRRKIKIKNIARKRWQETEDPRYKTTLNKLNKEVKKLFKEIKKNSWKNLFKDAQPDDLSLHKIINNRKKKKNRHSASTWRLWNSNSRITGNGRINS
ncbi:putative RNA-directed DNA polymerase from transposon X-element [Nephila pilipes]|uniref:Putative RNA-directed DNA polymerase from transposon X-element n=1 Tax=Nephila pilipes TaxID=299642 RepID=A0A8X6N6N8_NEPPI|nr:putative RNA-directed DNA polymerase from transposon X-element [Nephila pilipes]